MAFGSLLGFRNTVAGEISNPNTNVRKNAGGNAWNGRYESTTDAPANTTCYVKFNARLSDFVGATGNFCVCGFSRTGDTPAVGYTSIRYGAYARVSSGVGSFRVFELGTQVHSGIAFNDNDVFEVHRDGGTGVITYRLNGVTQYTSSTTDINGLFVHGSHLGENQRIDNVLFNRGNGEFTPFWENVVNHIDY